MTFHSEDQAEPRRQPILRLTFRRLPSVASGRKHVGDAEVFNRAGSTLAVPFFGPGNGVHPTPLPPYPSRLFTRHQ